MAVDGRIDRDHTSQAAGGKGRRRPQPLPSSRELPPVTTRARHDKVIVQVRKQESHGECVPSRFRGALSREAPDHIIGFEEALLQRTDPF